MFHRLWTLIRKELQSLLREPQTRAILVLPVLLQVLLFPFAATLEVTNATIAIYNEDNGKHSVELTQRFARAKAFTHILLLKSPGDPAHHRYAKSIIAGAFSGRFFPQPGYLPDGTNAVNPRRAQLQQRPDCSQLSSAGGERLPTGVDGRETET